MRSDEVPSTTTRAKKVEFEYHSPCDAVMNTYRPQRRDPSAMDQLRTIDGSRRPATNNTYGTVTEGDLKGPSTII